MIRVVLPGNLRALAGTGTEVSLDVAAPVTLRRVLDALEERHPPLRGTLRDLQSQQRRAMIRFFCCQEDYSNAGIDEPLPEAVATGAEPLLVVGAIAGG